MTHDAIREEAREPAPPSASEQRPPDVRYALRFIMLAGSEGGTLGRPKLIIPTWRPGRPAADKIGGER